MWKKKRNRRWKIALKEKENDEVNEDEEDPVVDFYYESSGAQKRYFPGG